MALVQSKEAKDYAHRVALQTAFLYAGACEALLKARGEWANGGYVGMATDMAIYAEVVCDALFPYEADPDTRWPGVFEYEVTEALGEWLVNNRANYFLGPKLPDVEFEAEIHKRITAFFAQ